MNIPQNDTDWAPLFDPLPSAEADRQLSRWRDDLAARGVAISEDDIRRDLVYSETGKHLVRYCVRGDLIPEK